MSFLFDTKPFFDRVLRAAKLDVTLYEEVEADKSATPQALGVVIFSSLAAGIGTIGQIGGYGNILEGLFFSVLGWLIMAGLTFWVGTRIFPEPQTKADFGELLRTIGFSTAPGLIRVLGIFPGLTHLVFLIAAIWNLIALVIAVRQALDYESTFRAIGVCVIGWVVQFLILAPVFLLSP